MWHKIFFPVCLLEVNKQFHNVNEAGWTSLTVSSCLCVEVDVSDATKTAEAFLKIASVYKEENNDVKTAVLDSVGETSAD